MPDFLLVTGEDPVDLYGMIDGAGALQVKHGADCLVDYTQTVHAAHTDLDQSTGLVMIKIFDFTSGGDTWQMTAIHGTTSWARGTDYAYYEFGPQTTPVEVDITATSNASPPQTKTRKAWMKPKPASGQPDEPR
ncbi:hypothetical protein ACNOYE_30770 [Nannocystaceae bacterium ST9]